MYYAIYEEAKQAFGANEDERHHPMATAAAGALATAAGDAVNLPLDVVKQRLQVCVPAKPHVGPSPSLPTPAPRRQAHRLI